MPSTVQSLSHPIIFVFDHANDGVEIPEYDSALTASSTASCISVRTIAEVDGDVVISLDRERDLHAMPDGAQVYAGLIETPHHAVAVVDSLNDKLLEAAVGKGSVFVKVFVDDQEHPTKVSIVVD